MLANTWPFTDIATLKDLLPFRIEVTVIFDWRTTYIAHCSAANTVHHVAAFLFVEAFMALVALADHGFVDLVLDADAHVALGLLFNLVASQRQMIGLLAVPSREIQKLEPSHKSRRSTQQVTTTHTCKSL